MGLGQTSQELARPVQKKGYIYYNFRCSNQNGAGSASEKRMLIPNNYQIGRSPLGMRPTARSGWSLANL